MPNFILDGQQVDEPRGIRDVNQRVYWSDALAGYIQEFQGSVFFYGSAYQYIRSAFASNKCAIMPVRWTNTSGEAFEGNIFLNDCIYRPALSEVECEIVDSGFLSVIDNNKGIRAYLDVGKSKNEVDITSVVNTQCNLTFPKWDVGNASDTVDRCGVRVYDAFALLVEFMTDGQMGFYSDLFNPSNYDANIEIPTLITGWELRIGDNERYPHISFKELYDDINKAYNVGFAVRFINGRPHLQIERKSYFRQLTATTLMADVFNPEQSAQRDTFYAKVQFGSARQDEEYLYLPRLQFLAWKQEEYHLGGQCNTASILDLRLRTLITDTNIIQQILPMASGGYGNDLSNLYNEQDEQILLVICDSTNTVITYANPTDADKVYYNDLLMNARIAQRWGDGIPSSIYAFLGMGLDGALASTTANYILDAGGTEWVDDALYLAADFPFYANRRYWGYFPDTSITYGYDPSGNITQELLWTDPLLGDVWRTKYAVQTDGIYSVSIDINYYQGRLQYALVRRSDSLDVMQGFEIMAGPFAPPLEDDGFGNPAQLVASASIYAQAGDILTVVFIGIDAPIVNAGPLSTVRIDDPFGGEWQVYDERDNYLINTSFKYPIPKDQWASILSNIFGQFTATYNTGQTVGFIKEIERNTHTGDASVSILSNFVTR